MEIAQSPRLIHLLAFTNHSTHPTFYDSSTFVIVCPVLQTEAILLIGLPIRLVTS